METAIFIVDETAPTVLRQSSTEPWEHSRASPGHEIDVHSSDEHSSGPNILEQDRGRTSGTKPVCFTQGLETRASVNTQPHADEAAEANVQHTTAMSTVSACDSRCVCALSTSTSKQYSPVVKKFVNTCNGNGCTTKLDK